ncbi:hypothetical protein CPB84DRAFT_1748814 [Gymnopilus junonius]|uniref:Uncharacterized protein n=1 Tax=Gymnopilus junonius TaxID=109634 RepID=A0A9P5NK75_GYMJU|nr:hypothetical protein CPB84DRAFT_1748814 [Gymnopilus junonius]
MPRASKKQPAEFTASTSTAHKEKEEAANNVRDNKGITAFFQKAVHKSSAVTTSSSTSTPVLSPSHVEPPSMPPPSIPDAIVIPDTLPFPQHNSSTIFYLDSSHPSSTSLLCQLELVTASLPPSIPEGELSDVLAQFSGNPAFDPGDDAWEMVDQALNRVIGFGMSTEEISKVVHHGLHLVDEMLEKTHMFSRARIFVLSLLFSMSALLVKLTDFLWLC